MSKQKNVYSLSLFSLFTISMILILPVFTYGQRLFYPEKTIYLDSKNDKDTLQDGTFQHPYSSFDKITFESKCRYMLKKSSDFTVDHIIIDENLVEITTFGFGHDPIIRSNATGNKGIIDISDKNNIIIDGVQIIGNNNSVAGIQIKGNEITGIHIKTCNISKVQFGIRVIAIVNDFIITDCNIHNIAVDGIYAMNFKDIEISYCSIHHVNEKWEITKNEKESSGDCIQLYSDSGMTFKIHHNTLDHSSSGNKFCFIAYGKDYAGYIENNTFIANEKLNNSCIYLHPTTKEVYIMNNWMESGSFGVYSYADNIKIYYNLFLNQEVPISLMENSKAVIFNNLFYQNKYVLYAESKTSVNLFNNIVSKVSQSNPYETKGELISDYNLYDFKNKRIKYEKNSIEADPMFALPDNSNYQLKEGSPCIDKGRSHKIDKDLKGAYVPYGPYPEIGPFEYHVKKAE